MPRSAARPEQKCLTDELLVGLLDGRLNEEELARAHAHAARCDECCELLAEVARGGLHEKESREPPPSEPPAGSWNPPAEFDEFKLVRLLGRGAMGVVHLAQDRTLQRQVAVKFIAAHQPSAQIKARFQTEARAIARLTHPNVVTVFRVGEIDGHPYIVSEYLSGHSLAKLDFPVPWRRALGVGIGLARGLAAAHRQSVLHRDLKPDNVFLSADGQVKLLDFGLAELVEAGSSEARGRARAAGTPRYMAPELFRGMPASQQSDVYALGLILYELCTGTLPQRHPATVRTPRSARSGPGPAPQAEQDRIPPLTERVPGIAPDFAEIIQRCLHFQPEERFASTDKLSAALEQLEPLHEPATLPEGNPYRGLDPFEAEHRALFFGRDADIRAVSERLRYQPLVLIAGDSGVGKSSLCRAGILPRAARGALDEYRDFTPLTLTPGQRPMEALAAVLAPILEQPEVSLLSRLNSEQNWLGPELRKLYLEERGLLLFVDQLEELVTVSDPVQAARFAILLGELALPSAGVRVLLAVRGDFLTRIGTLPGLGNEVERALQLLRPLTEDGVREAITGPARSRGVTFESEALVQTLVEATKQGAGSLPLLQFSLAELWARRDTAGHRITRAALDAMGGVAGALSRHADGVLARLTPAQQEAARRLFSQLITVEGTRSKRSEAELTASSDDARAALRMLVRERLLHARTEAGHSSYEIAHEALIERWGTLRNWLDEDAGQRALRQRVEEAGAQWERLGRPEDLLWRRRQLNEVRALDTTTLGTRDQDFLKASQHAVRRQNVQRWVVVLLFLLTAGGIWGGQWVLGEIEKTRFVNALLRKAEDELSRGRALGKKASAGREIALALFDGQAPAGSSETPNAQELWERAEEAWQLALVDLADANAAFGEAEQSLDDAMKRVYEHPEAHQLLIELIRDRIVLAEQFHRNDERVQLEQRFRRLTANDKTWKGWLDRPAVLELVTEPPGASVEITRYEEDDKGVLQRKPVPGHEVLGTSPIAPISLLAGSYHLRIARDGQPLIHLPLVLEREQHQQVRLALPTQVPKGYVYIPPGCFLAGSADIEAMRRFQRSEPLHRHCMTEGYLIGQTEVTVGDWLAYVDTLPGSAPERRLLDKPRSSFGGAIRLQHRPEGGWSFSLQLESGTVLTARDGEPIRYPNRRHHSEQNWRRFPLSGVSAEDVASYLSWLNTSGRLRGARLCQENEWTRAARGADDRSYPHGTKLHQDDANIDVTSNRLPNAYGPDEVGAHPVSVSPFGVYDMVGNAFEVTEPAVAQSGRVIGRGGAWYYSDITAMVAHREPATAQNRDATLGVRICAPFPLK